MKTKTISVVPNPMGPNPLNLSIIGFPFPAFPFVWNWIIENIFQADISLGNSQLSVK